MSFGGSVSAMISSLKNNKMILGKRNNIYDNRRKYKKAAEKLKLTHKEISKEELNQIKERVLAENKRTRLISIIMFIVLTVFCIWLITGIFSTTDTEINKREAKKQRAKIEKYHFYILDGDSMFTKRKWDNAIFQYRHAKSLFPKQYDVQYRLALAYTYKCTNTNKQCFIADSLVIQLMNYYPEKEEIQRLNSILKNHLND